MGHRLGIVGLLLLSVAACTGCAPATPPNVPTVQVPVGPSSRSSIETKPGAQAREAHVEGEAIDIEWHGSWFPGVVVGSRDARWLVHYEGYGDEWDEVVGEDRIRERGSTARAPEPEEPDDDP